jgi:catechol 2,3-dioxygenase-like lactoylglutathione lyase family enzyme
MSATRPRGIDHVGVTVQDFEAAERFLIDGLGAEFIYEVLRLGDTPFEGPAFERALNLPPGARLDRIRMYQLGNGPGIELFHYHADDQRPPPRASDLGWQHIALYVDRLEAAVARMVAAGGAQLGEPWDLPGIEKGPGNRLCFVKAPFDALIEVLSYPAPQPYEELTDQRRWKPASLLETSANERVAACEVAQPPRLSA